MRPETLALMFTNFLGLTSPEADTMEMRSFRPTFWVWTSTVLRLSRLMLIATTAPRIATPTTDPRMIRLFLVKGAYLQAHDEAGCHLKYARTPQRFLKPDDIRLARTRRFQSLRKLHSRLKGTRLMSTEWSLSTTKRSLGLTPTPSLAS